MLRSTLFILFLIILFVNCEQTHTRAKRSYYGGYDMYGDDFWYLGRIIGMIIGILLLLFCCCLPCVCLAGIWFAGWFGLRRGRDSKPQAATKPTAQQMPTEQAIYPRDARDARSHIPTHHNYNNTPHQIHVDSSPSDVSRVIIPGDQVIFEAEDRFYTSTTSAPAPQQYPARY